MAILMTHKKWIEHLWPICDFCQRPVDDFQIQNNFYHNNLMFGAFCHGEKEIVELDHFETLQIQYPWQIKSLHVFKSQEHRMVKMTKKENDNDEKN